MFLVTQNRVNLWTCFSIFLNWHMNFQTWKLALKDHCRTDEEQILTQYQYHNINLQLATTWAHDSVMLMVINAGRRQRQTTDMTQTIKFFLYRFLSLWDSCHYLLTPWHRNHFEHCCFICSLLQRDLFSQMPVSLLLRAPACSAVVQSELLPFNRPLHRTVCNWWIAAI